MESVFYGFLKEWLSGWKQKFKKTNLKPAENIKNLRAFLLPKADFRQEKYSGS